MLEEEEEEEEQDDVSLVVGVVSVDDDSVEDVVEVEDVCPESGASPLATEPSFRAAALLC